MEAVPVLNGLWIMILVVGLAAIYRVFSVEWSHRYPWLLAISLSIGVTWSNPGLGLILWSLILLVSTLLYLRDTLGVDRQAHH